jgi:hypothetical protein
MQTNPIDLFCSRVAALVRPLAIAGVIGLSLGGFPVAAHASDPQVFETPEAAAAALIAALESKEAGALLNVLGDEFKDELQSGDEAADRHDRETVLAAAKEVMQLRKDDEDTRVMVVGKQAWPVPFPIIHTDKGWMFDTGAGVDELLARRVGRNELAAISTLRAYVEAQMEYAGVDRDGDDVLEYAQRIVSTPGAEDGLYWPAPEGSGKSDSPFGPFVAEQSANLEGREAGDPFMGYYFRILTRQDSAAPGGRYDYIINGNMIAGFAMLAYPAQYGESGVMSFLVSHQGKVMERDLGENTPLLAAGVDDYDPQGWAPVEE